MKAPKRKQRTPGTTAKQKAKKGKGLNERILELEAENKRLKEDCQQYRMMDKANYVVCGKCGKEYHTLKLFDCPHCEKAKE